MDEQLARLRTHRKNIDRYRNLLKKILMEHERLYLERRLSEEQSALEALAALTLTGAAQIGGAQGTHELELVRPS